MGACDWLAASVLASSLSEEAAWSKKVVSEGTGAAAFPGAQARVHVVGRATLDKAVTGRAKEHGFALEALDIDCGVWSCPVDSLWDLL